MTPPSLIFFAGLVVGCFATVLLVVLLPEARAELRAARQRKALTAEAKADQNRRLRLVLGGAVRTPMPARKLKTRDNFGGWA